MFAHEIRQVADSPLHSLHHQSTSQQSQHLMSTQNASNYSHYNRIAEQVHQEFCIDEVNDHHSRR